VTAGGPQHSFRSSPQTVVLVEGESDRTAVETLALRCGRDLAAEGVQVIAIGGATNIRSYLRRYRPDAASPVKVAGLCDEGEAAGYARALSAVEGVAINNRAEMEARGFFVCCADLEDELIRALGTDAVIAVLDAQGELKAFRALQKQPAQRERALEAQLHRFMGAKSRRKARYARALVDALDLGQVPGPLACLLAHV
jgi:hypothetical protein